MENKIIYAALLFLAGWLWYFLIVRQFVFNFTTVMPMLKRFKSAEKTKEQLISVNANRFVWISVFVWFLISVGLAVLVVFLCRNHIYLWISFFVGGVIGVITFIGRYTPSTKRNFLDFCSSYYRFIFDDELRTAMYNGKISQMKTAFNRLEINKDLIIPEFKHEK